MQVESSDQRQTNDTAISSTNEDSSRVQHSETIKSKRSLLYCRMSKRKSSPKNRIGSSKMQAESSDQRQMNDTSKTPTGEETSRIQLSETIQNKRSTLTLCMNPDDGLLDELIAVGVITRQQDEVIRSKPTTSSRADQLLTFVINMPDDKQKQFLVALDKNQQNHVGAYLRVKGNLSSLHRDGWPLLLCSEFRITQREWAKLVELMECKCGLLDELFSVGFISDRQMKSIKAQRTDVDQNTALLNKLYCKSFADFSKFLRCLEITKQSFVASLLSTSDTCSEEPLNDVTISRLVRNHSKLVDLIDTKHNLLAELVACDCISLRQRKYVESAESQAEVNGRLLVIVRRGSKKDFNQFVECLEKTGQEHVANVLLNDGVVVHMEAKTNCSSTEETTVVDRIKVYLKASVDQSSRADRETVCNQVIAYVNELRSHDVDVVAFKKENSIGIFYFCRSLTGLQHLNDLYSSGQLKLILENVFSELLNDDKSVVVESLHWDLPDFNCMQCLCSSVDLQVFSKLYAMSTSSVECIMSSIHIDQFPCEIQELILMKSTGQLFVKFNKVTPLAAVYSMATMCGVSKLWWNSLIYRQHNRRVMKRYFQQVCSPFKCNPRRLQSLQVERNVAGLTEFNGKLYVVCLGSSAVRVFISRSPFSRLDDINVQGLLDPSDVVVCNDKSQLYIADGGGSQHGIWRVNLLNNKQVDKFITTEWWPLSLSINSSRLLITPNIGAALFLYKDDGSKLNHIQLPKYMLTRHAVETTNKTYIVCYEQRYIESEEVYSVSEFDVDGRVVRTFNNQHIDIDTIKFNWPLYLVIDGNNHVIVADTCNKRVVLLKSNLQLKRVLIPTLDGRPYRLCLSKSTGLMFINYYQSSNIDIYQVKSVE